MIPDSPGVMAEFTEKSMSQSLMMAFVFQPEKKEKNILHENVLLAANCYVLANYDIAGLGNYNTDQIKADWDKQLLVDTSSFDLSNQISKYTKGWIEPFTELDQTVILLESICKQVFERAYGIGKCIKGMKGVPYNLIERYEKLTVIALFVFGGLKRMHDTYSKQYQNQKESKKGIVELKRLYTKIAEWGKTISELYCKTISPPCQIDVTKNRFDTIVIGRISKKVQLQPKTVFLSEVNNFFLQDQEYYQSLCHLSVYDLKESCDYSSHQIKAFDKTKLLVPTGTRCINNWCGQLTPLKQTVVVLKEHCERAKQECEDFSNHFLPSLKMEQGIKDNLGEEVDQIIHKAIPGVQRMAKTYLNHYSKKPKHPGLDDLHWCSLSLTWINRIVLK
jgi:hypothetical protein